jgi:hypothetical protein
MFSGLNKSIVICDDYKTGKKADLASIIPTLQDALGVSFNEKSMDIVDLIENYKPPKYLIERKEMEQTIIMSSMFHSRHDGDLSRKPMSDGWGIGAGLLRKRKNAPVRQSVGGYIPKVIYLRRFTRTKALICRLPRI